MERESRIYIAGHKGLVGSALMRMLSGRGYRNVIVKRRDELDLRCQLSVRSFFEKERPDYVFLAAAKVGGIWANDSYPADFIYDNVMIQSNVIHEAYRANVKKLLFLGSSCIYPRDCPQPIKERYLLSGPLEKTNEAYAVAKICGIRMCQSYRKQYGCNYISGMPTNLYGPNDNFDLKSAHVIPALIRKFYEGKVQNKPSVEIWGSGNPRREFLYVDDLAEASLFLMEQYNESEIINIGTNKDASIIEIAGIIKECIGYKGAIVCNPAMPDGTPQKLLDVTRINALGWAAKTLLQDGIRNTVKWYTEEQK
ncbi:MAG: GDP-L-fucose synthase [Candidatus Omnitrophica bacterium]|nr:GDP-L-fucose synthase [Candidatus Omnitrophota bacterium]